jgi:Fe-S oxidoreductase
MSGTDRCMKCSSCVRACPVVAEVGEMAFPGPRTIAVDSPRFGPSSVAIAEVAWLCSMCERCADACPSRIPLPKAMLDMRTSLYPNVRVRPGHERLLGNIDRYGLSIEPVRKVGERSTPQAKIAYFPGCIASQREVETMDGSLGLLGAAGAKVEVPGGLVCCGSPLSKLGDERRRERLMEANLKILERYDQVVTSCPGCTVQLVEGYGLEALHITEFLTEVTGTKGMRFRAGSQTIRLAVHHACHLSRGVGPHTKERTYELLSEVPGIELISTGEETVCCGAGGSLLSGYPDVAGRMAARKIDNAISYGAQAITAACPFCAVNLRRPGGIEVMELTQLIASRLRFPGQH